MKTINTIILALLVSASTIASAQDASNDATLQETVNFILDNDYYIKNNFDIKFTNNNTVLEITHNQSNNMSRTLSIPLSKISEVVLDEDEDFPCIDINTFGDMVEWRAHFDNHISHISMGTLWIDNSSMRKRIHKALLHLAFLSTGQTQAGRMEEKF